MKLCDDDHIAFTQSALVIQHWGRRAAMHQALSVTVVATLLIATVVDVVASG